MLFVCVMLIFFKLCHGLLTHSLFISNIILHHAQCFYSVGFPNSIFSPFFMKGLCVLYGEITLKNNHYYFSQILPLLNGFVIILNRRCHFCFSQKLIHNKIVKYYTLTIYLKIVHFYPLLYSLSPVENIKSPIYHCEYYLEII